MLDKPTSTIHTKYIQHLNRYKVNMVSKNKVSLTNYVVEQKLSLKMKYLTVL